jgi:iron complex outermembrane recepter protein
MLRSQWVITCVGRTCRIRTIAHEFEQQGRDFEQELHEWAQENTNILRLDAGRSPDGSPRPIDYPIAVDSIDGTISNCVPLNPLGVGNVSPEAWDYITDTKEVISDVDQHFLEIMAQGIVHEGWGPGAIHLAVGATYREESISQGVPAHELAIDALGPPHNVTLDTGEVIVRGIPTGHSAGSPFLHRFSTFPTFAGGFDVWEVFGETIAPLYAAGNRRLEASLAARFAEYSRAGSVWTYKGGVDFQITNDLRFRGTYSRDVREGSFSEMFDFQAVGAFINDPARDMENYGTTQFALGTPDIRPEEADTTVVGFVYQPSWAAGLQMSADWYDIKLSEAIGQLGPQRIVNECFESNIYCELIDRGADGRVTRVRNIFLNIDAARVRGADVEVSYRMQPNLFAGRAEALSQRHLGGRLVERSDTPLDGTRQNSAGSEALPKWSSQFSAAYTVGGFTVNVQNRFTSRTKRNINWIEGFDVVNNTNSSSVLTNLRLSYRLDTGANGSLMASLNVQNLFDRQPPALAGAFGGGRGFDPLGRRYSLDLRYRF